MTIRPSLFYKVPPNRYVLYRKTKESMLSSFGVTAEETEDWLCPECFDERPPAFLIPPPPCPPSIDLPSGLLVGEGGGDPPTTCPAFMGAREDVPQGEKIPLAAVAITAVISVVLVTMIACVVYRVRMQKKRPSKSPPTEGAIIYDDLTPSIQPLSRGRQPPHIIWSPMGDRYPPRYTQTPSIGRSDAPARSKGTLVGSGGEAYEISLTSSEDTAVLPPSEPLYHTISSASGSGSERCSSEAQVIFSTPSPRRCPPSDSEEDDSSTPFIAGGLNPPCRAESGWGPNPPCSGESDSLNSPSHARYYLSVPLDSVRAPSTSTLASSNEYETLPLRVGLVGEGRPLTPHERGLPPLPSRSERFRMFLPADRGRGPLPPHGPFPTRHRKGPAISRDPHLRHEVLYENIVPSSNL